MRKEIKDTNCFYVGWSEDTGNEVLYYTIRKGFIGKFVKSNNRYIFMDKSRVGQLGPCCDIGPAEVLRFEGTK